MIFLKYPKTVIVEKEIIDEVTDTPIGTENVQCEVLMVSKKYMQEGEVGKETFVVLCYDAEGNVYEEFLNEVQVVETKDNITDNKLSSDGNTHFGPKPGPFKKSRAGEKNRKRPLPSQYRKDGT